MDKDKELAKDLERLEEDTRKIGQKLKLRALARKKENEVDATQEGEDKYGADGFNKGGQSENLQKPEGNIQQNTSANNTPPARQEVNEVGDQNKGAPQQPSEANDFWGASIGEDDFNKMLLDLELKNEEQGGDADGRHKGALGAAEPTNLKEAFRKEGDGNGAGGQVAIESWANRAFLPTGNKIIDSDLEEGKMDPFGYYFLKKVGVNIVPTGEYGESGRLKLSQSLRRLGGDKDFQELKPINAALNNLSSIILNANTTSGTWNNMARLWSKWTGHNFLSADDDNQQRIIDESSLGSNYQAVMARASGGTFKEREQMREAITFGGLNEEQTLLKAHAIASNLLEREANIIKSLNFKGFDTQVLEAAFRDNDLQNLAANVRAFYYLNKSLKDGSFDREVFAEVLDK